MTVLQLLPFILISIIAVIILSTIFRKRNELPEELFIEGLKKENNGFFEEAIVSYENALREVKKSRLESILEDKIIEKLKVLHSMIEYKNSLSYTRTGYPIAK